LFAADVAVDPYMLASRLQSDAVVAYHAALQFHGRAYSLWRRFHYLTSARTLRFSFRGAEFVPVRARSHELLDDGVVDEAHGGGSVRVTTLERTLVDVLDAPRYGGGWEEIWRSLEMVEFFDLDAVVEHALKRGVALTAARVGFFLEQHRELLMVEERHLDALRAHAPAQPLYFDRKREAGKLVHSWNLVVPERVLQRSWEDIG
jgi:predicted transcriptional regulator of viral defense system